MPLTHLLKPISINKLEVKNRILRTGHGTYYGRGSITDDLIAYHEARARSGVGLTTLEVTCVHRSSVNNTLFGWDDEIIPGFRKISAAMHNHGMKLFTQLWHGGQHWPPADGQPPGTVHIALCAGGGAVVQTLALAGSRDEIRRGTVERSLRLLWSVLWEECP